MPNNSSSRLMLSTARHLEFHPTIILLYVNARLANGKLSRKVGIALEKPLDCSAVAGSDAPPAVLPHQILLHYDFAFGCEGLTDSSKQLSVGYCDISRDAHSADIYAVQYVSILRPLQRTNETRF